MPVAALTHAPAKISPDSSRSKLTIGAVNDPLEFEADAIADRVMQGYGARPATASSSQTIRRKCACAGSGQPCSKCEQEDRQSLLRKAVGPDSATHSEAPPVVRDVLRSPGQPLDRPTRSFMESRFGYDLSHVRIHADSRAARSAESVDAQAYTVGRNVVFGAGQYNPASQDKRRLLAHELAHVVQQSGATGPGTLVQRKKKGGITVASCGLLNLAGSFTRIGELAHIQVQGFLAARGVGPEFAIPRATKQGFRYLKLGCQPADTPFGFADLARRSGIGFDLGEIKPATFGGPARAALEGAHYRRRARQSMQRVFKTPGTCARRTAGLDDEGFALWNALNPASDFSLLSDVLSSDKSGEPIGPFTGDPSLTLRARQVGPGAVCYWCTKGGQDDKKEEPKPPGPSVGAGLSAGSSAGGAYNAGVGVAIMSDSTAYGTAGAGVSYKSDSKAAGAAGAGASVESNATAAGVAGAGATQDAQSIGAGAAGAGTSKDSASAAAGVASKGSVQDSATAGAGVASKGEVKDSTVAGAGATGSGKLEGVAGAGTGSPGNPVDAKDVEGSGKSATPAPEGAGSPNTAAKDAAGKDAAGRSGATGSGSGSAPAKDASEGAAAKGAQGAKDVGPDAGGGSDVGPRADKDGSAEAGKDAGTAAKAGSGLGVIPLAGPAASEADRQTIAEEASKVAALLANASAAQVALFRYLAQSSPNGQYVVPASQWVRTMMDATAGLSEDDIRYLQSLDWKPSNITPEELRKRIDDLLKSRKPSTSGDTAAAAGGDKDNEKGQGQGKGAQATGKALQSGGSGGGAGKGKDGASSPELVTPRKYTGQLASVNDTGFQIQADDTQITARTAKGTKVNLEILWREGGAIKRARVQYEIVGGPETVADPKSGKNMLRFDLRSTNTDPLDLSPPGAEKPTVLPAQAPGSYFIFTSRK